MTETASGANTSTTERKAIVTNNTAEIALLYKRLGNHWKSPRRFGRGESEQEESQPPWKTGTLRSLKDIIKAKPRRAPWK
jgi:hypothetical protein